jgi:hydrogenase expression/formation protein HypD
MKYLDEYRDPKIINILTKKICGAVTNNWTIMEICGGQTHTILKYNLQELLPPKINLVHGPGCPVCVTPLEMIDKALTIASTENVILTSFGDMLRVPGSGKDLLKLKADGFDIRIVYSPLDALRIAQENSDKKVVFFAVGFETTAPLSAAAVLEVQKKKLYNFSILSAHVLVPPAIEFILSSDENRVQAFLAAGHVCAITGYEDYMPISFKYKKPIVVTGFEPVDILNGIYCAVLQLEKGMYKVENQYSRAVNKEGNTAAKKVLRNVFDTVDRKWRGIGLIPNSGLTLKKEFEDFDAENIFNLNNINTVESELCSSGKVLQGLLMPNECKAFGKECIPEHPLGAPMVSSEGACAAYYRYLSHPKESALK